MATESRSDPLVAVVTPVFNGEKYLRATMEAVQAQTYPSIVHVVLDNASTDSTPQIIDSFRQALVPLLVRRNPTTIPLSQNWNAALAFVPPEAKYFTILCADDLIDPTFVAKLTAIAESDSEVELVGCMHRFGDAVAPTALPGDRTTFDGREVVSDFLNKRANDIPHMWGLFRRRETDPVADFFDNTIYMFDTNACIRAMVRGKFGFVHEPIYIYRQHPQSISETVIRGSTHRLFDSMVQIERWGPLVMGEAEYHRCAKRHLRAIYRYMLRARYRGDDSEYRAFLAARKIQPGIVDLAYAVAEWPFQRMIRYVRALV
jgi:glycosyltransferase involved in cell wall biosynthesis